MKRKDLKYIPSIAGYNSIYKAEIIKKYMYSTKYAFFFDDIEINFFHAITAARAV